MAIELPKPIAVTPVPNVRYREFTKCGQKPLAGGQIWTYEANSTTPKITYQDPYGMTPNTNPIILDAAGEADIYLNGTYRFVVKDKNGVVQKDVGKIGSWFSGDLEDQMKSVNDILDTSAQKLMQPLKDAIDAAAAAGAGDNGWNSLLVVDGKENQSQINDQTLRNFETILDLLTYAPRRDGQTVFVKSYYGGWAVTYPLLGPCGGGNFVYNSDRAKENDGVLIFNGWERQVKGSKISVHDAGARGDYDTTTGTGTDDSEAIQRALKVSYSLGLRTSGQLGDKCFTVNCDGNRNYYVASPVLQPANVTMNGNGCTWYGNNKLNDGIHSAYWVDGQLVDLVPKPLETAHLFRSHIKNILFKKFKYSMNLRGFTFCSIQDCSSMDCVRHLSSVEHYFLRVIRNKAESCDLGYYFSVFSGMLSFQTVSASNCTNGFYFANAAQAVKINNIAVEGTTTTAIYIEGQGNTGGISIQHCYFEGDIKSVVEVSTNTWGSVTLAHNFVNLLGSDNVLARDKANCKFIIEDNNYLQNCPVLLDTSTTDMSRSRTVQNPISWSGGSLAPNSKNATSYDKNKYLNDRPDLWITNEHSQIIYEKRSASGYTQAIHKHFFGLVPAIYYGYQGAPEANIVPFCTHSGTDATSGSTSLFNISLATSITKNSYLSAIFNLVIYHDSGVKSLVAGKIYGNEVVLDIAKTSGTTNPRISVTLTDISGALVLVIGGLTGSYVTGAYTCTGFIKLI